MYRTLFFCSEQQMSNLFYDIGQRDMSSHVGDSSRTETNLLFEKNINDFRTSLMYIFEKKKMVHM